MVSFYVESKYLGSMLCQTAQAAHHICFALTRQLLKELRLVGGYDVLYGKVKAFVRESLFEGSPVAGLAASFTEYQS